MSIVKQLIQRRERRKRRVRKKIYGTPERPRMSVSRSLQHIYVQLIDDTTGRTLASASTLSKDLRGQIKYGGNIAAAKVVGKVIGEQAVARGITTVAFDRNGLKYHGRIKALADAAREAGLKF